MKVIINEQWVKHVRDAELKNDNLEKIKEMRDIVKEPERSIEIKNIKLI